MVQLGVGRHPLREAMKALQAVGIIEIRHGFGTYVGQVTLEALEDGLAFKMSQSMTGDLRDVQNVLEVRQAIEVGLAPATTYSSNSSPGRLAVWRLLPGPTRRLATPPRADSPCGGLGYGVSSREGRRGPACRAG